MLLFCFKFEVYLYTKLTSTNIYLNLSILEYIPPPPPPSKHVLWKLVYKSMNPSTWVPWKYAIIPCMCCESWYTKYEPIHLIMQVEYLLLTCHHSISTIRKHCKTTFNYRYLKSYQEVDEYDPRVGDSLCFYI